MHFITFLVSAVFMSEKHSVMALMPAEERLEVAVVVVVGGGYTREPPPKWMYNQALIPRPASGSLGTIYYRGAIS